MLGTFSLIFFSSLIEIYVVYVTCIFAYYTPTTKCGGGGYTGFALSRRSVGRSPILVRSITPLLMEGFPSNLNDTFTSTRGCAVPMLPMCQVKVKVTVKGQILNKQILDFMSCPLYKPNTNGMISLDVHSPCCPCVSSRSRSQLKVKYLTNKY